VDKKRLIEIACAMGMVLAYVLIKALASHLNVDLGDVGPFLRMLFEAALPMGAGALLFPRPSDSAALRGEEG
jgi:hypothetical protein